MRTLDTKLAAIMNGRQRLSRGIRSHESGSTIMKKIAKVAVGKSTEAAQLLTRPSAVVTECGRAARRAAA